MIGKCVITLSMYQKSRRNSNKNGNPCKEKTRSQLIWKIPQLKLGLSLRWYSIPAVTEVNE